MADQHSGFFRIQGLATSALSRLHAVPHASGTHFPDAVAMNPPCVRCNGPHPFDTVVPSTVWNDVVRAGGYADYLCFTCIVSIFAKRQRSFTAELVGGDFNLLPIEIRIGRKVAKDAASISAENTELRNRIRELEHRLYEDDKEGEAG